MLRDTDKATHVGMCGWAGSLSPHWNKYISGKPRVSQIHSTKQVLSRSQISNTPPLAQIVCVCVCVCVRARVCVCVWSVSASVCGVCCPKVFIPAPDEKLVTGQPLQDIRLRRGCCARINYACIPPTHLHCSPWCSTIARLLNSIRLPSRPPV